MKDIPSFLREKPPFRARLLLIQDALVFVVRSIPILDFIAVLITAQLSGFLLLSSEPDLVSLFGMEPARVRLALAVAVLAPMVLFDLSLLALVKSKSFSILAISFLMRIVLLLAALTAILLASPSLMAIPHSDLLLWLAVALLTMTLTRLILLSGLQRLDRGGALNEIIALVGAGPVADGLITYLQQTRDSRIDILGVFDDSAGTAGSCINRPCGSVSDLIELGKNGRVDWILLALPDSAEFRQSMLVHRLKSLAVPVGLCPTTFDAPRSSEPGKAGFGSVLASSLDAAMPRWVLLLLGLPLQLLQIANISIRDRFQDRSPPSTRRPKLFCPLDDYDLSGFTEVAAAFGSEHYGYVVTPNADHLIRLHQQPSFRTLYDEAAYVLLDSRFIANLMRITKRVRLPVCTGSDLTEKLFSDVIEPDDRIVLIGSSREQATQLTERYGLARLSHFQPPMGFIHDSAAVEDCLCFIEKNSPFRYCMLAVGAPQQEAIAHLLKRRGVARGLALCVGASINYLTGDERRAPKWMQRIGVEWFYRLMQSPARMADRYLIKGPRIFALLSRTRIELRGKSADR